MRVFFHGRGMHDIVDDLRRVDRRAGKEARSLVNLIITIPRQKTIGPYQSPVFLGLFPAGLSALRVRRSQGVKVGQLIHGGLWC